MIDSDAKLAAWLPKLAAADWVAIDTEADSLHAYPEKLCLLQVSIPGGEELLDPLSGMGLTPALEVWRRHELILHGADYDLRLLRKSLDFVPASIFDTMLAGRLVGDNEFGLISLVAKYLGVKLEKGPQKANWGRRPLTERMETYARNDVRYLKPLADLLRQRLQETGRLGWHQEWCARLITECAEIRPADPDVVWRVKGSHRLEPAALAVLRELWRWREKEALRVNKPPYFMLTPEVMVELAMAAGEGGPVKALLPRHLTHHRREGILRAIEQGRSAAHPPRAPRSRPHRQNEAERRRVHELSRRRNRRAAELGIDPTLIASRALLVMLGRNWDAHQGELMRWQRELLEGPSTGGTGGTPGPGS